MVPQGALLQAVLLNCFRILPQTIRTTTYPIFSRGDAKTQRTRSFFIRKRNASPFYFFLCVFKMHKKEWEKYYGKETKTN